MRALDGCNPIAVFIYFLSAAGLTMFCMNPLILAMSLAGAVLLFFVRNGRKHLASHLVFLAMFVCMALVNPIFYHNGVTVLFVVNDSPITLEALLYGVAASAMITAVLYWFRSVSQLMTSDKLLYLFGSASPKLALMLAMVMRYIPLFGAQAKKVDQAQKALGLYRDDNAIDAIRGGARVFSIMVSWALENGIVTADSMTARGYGTGRRSFFSLYRFRRSDAALLTATLALTAITLTGIGLGAVRFDYYPAIRATAISPLSAITYISYGMLALLPSFIGISEEIRWKYLRSKI